jgi:hypothetical protein
MDLEKIKCTRCKDDMPKLRLDNYGYDFCVNCSDVKPKVGRIRVIGEGDYTVTELDVLDQDTARRLQELENNSRGVRNVPLEILNFDEDEMSDSIKAIDAATVVAMNDELVVEEDLELVDKPTADDEEEVDELDGVELEEEDE